LLDPALITALNTCFISLEDFARFVCYLYGPYLVGCSRETSSSLWLVRTTASMHGGELIDLSWMAVGCGHNGACGWLL